MKDYTRYCFSCQEIIRTSWGYFCPCKCSNKKINKAFASGIFDDFGKMIVPDHRELPTLILEDFEELLKDER